MGERLGQSTKATGVAKRVRGGGAEFGPWARMERPAASRVTPIARQGDGTKLFEAP